LSTYKRLVITSLLDNSSSRVQNSYLGVLRRRYTQLPSSTAVVGRGASVTLQGSGPAAAWYIYSSYRGQVNKSSPVGLVPTISYNGRWRNIVIPDFERITILRQYQGLHQSMPPLWPSLLSKCAVAFDCFAKTCSLAMQEDFNQQHYYDGSIL
jgi:hypothetical protein